MKKFTRILSLLLLLGMFLSLSGCSYLDELRASRAVAMEDGTIVLSDGTKYLRLPENEYFSPGLRDVSYIYILDDEEIPLLLTGLMGSYGYLRKDGLILQKEYSSIGQNYCRADIYDSILDRMNNGFTPELYCYTFFDYEGRALYTFTPQQAEALEDVLANREPYTLPAGAKLDCEYRVSLDHYSSDYLFRKDSVDICFADGAFYVVDGELIYSVPNNLYVTFARAVRKATE